MLQALEGLEIHPKCRQLPAILQITPDPANNNYANASIRIKFNMPLNDSAVDFVTVTCLGSNVLSYFQKPVLNESKDVIVITPKSTELTAFIESQKQGFVELLVSFEEGLSADIEGLPVFMKKDENSSFSFRYANVTETTPPTPVSFFLSRDYMSPDKDLSSLNKFYGDVDLSAIESYTQDPIVLTNMAGNYVYLYGTFWDDASGVTKISVYEYFKGTNDTSDPGTGYEKTADYYSESEGAEFFTDANSYTTFCIKHKLKSNDGAISLKVEASDLCDNKTFSKEEVICFKKTTIGFATKQGAYQIKNNPSKGEIITTLTTQELSHNLKTITFDGFISDEEYAFANVVVPITFYSIVCEYNGKQKKMTPQNWDTSEVLYWTIDLEDTEKISGMDLKFIVSDIFGNTVIKEYQIPKSEDYVCVPVNVTNNLVEISFLYKSSGVAGAPAYLKKASTATEYTFGCNEYNNYVLKIQDGYEYLAIPHCVFDSSAVEFYTEVTEPACVYSVASLQPDDVPKVVLKDYDDTGKPYKVSKSSLYAQNDIKVQIADDSWNNGYDNIILYVKDKACNIWRWIGDRCDFIINGDGAVNFTKNQTECTIPVLSQDMYESNCILLIFGQKGTHFSEGTSITITTDLALDNVPMGRLGESIYGMPVVGDAYTCNHEINNGVINETIVDYLKETDSYTITLNDFQTGVSSDCIIIEGTDFYEKYGKDISTPTKLTEVLDNLSSKDYHPNIFNVKSVTANSTTTYTITFPRWLVSKGYSYFFFDNAGNVTSGKNSGNRLTANDSYSEKESILYYWNNNSWKLFNSQTSVTEVFMKVGKYYQDFQIICPLEISYRGTNRNSTNYDYMYPPSSNNNILIQSDAPVFVQTVVTDASYEECKNWDASEWLYDNCRKIIKEQQLDFDSTHHDAKVYKIFADGQYTAYNDTCYVVIAHLADGTVMMSDVKQF